MDNKKMSVFVFIAMLFIAALFDLIGLVVFLIGLIPIVGIPFMFLGPVVSASFIFFARLGFWLAGYHSKGTTALTVATALFELIPGLSILPGCIVFVVMFYLRNKASDVISKVKVVSPRGVMAHFGS
jgi:hypothetical protein